MFSIKILMQISCRDMTTETKMAIKENKIAKKIEK
jgi:hypothetical protein